MRKIFLLPLVLLASSFAFAQQSRHFTFHYGFSVRNIQPGQRIEIWFPQASSDQFQEVKVVSVTGDLPTKSKREAKHGNIIFHAIASKAARDNYNVDVEYEVVRHERVALPRDGMQPVLIQASAKETNQYLGPDKLVPVSGRLSDIAAKQVQDHTGTIDRALALYDYVFNTMRYDKSGTGWGRGDAEWACDSKRGNCTDFHSVFISMARSQGIPARFEIGFPLPADQQSSEIAGYHCWSDFYVDGKGWIPVDISEAWKHPEKRDYFFGSHDVNRVQFSMGRDLRLNPPQEGKPLNYFVYPYVEVDGQEYPNVSLAFSFADAATAVAAR